MHKRGKKYSKKILLNKKKFQYYMEWVNLNDKNGDNKISSER